MFGRAGGSQHSQVVIPDLYPSSPGDSFAASNAQNSSAGIKIPDLYPSSPEDAFAARKAQNSSRGIKNRFKRFFGRVSSPNSTQLPRSPVLAIACDEQGFSPVGLGSKGANYVCSGKTNAQQPAAFRYGLVSQDASYLIPQANVQQQAESQPQPMDIYQVWMSHNASVMKAARAARELARTEALTRGTIFPPDIPAIETYERLYESSGSLSLIPAKNSAKTLSEIDKRIQRCCNSKEKILDFSGLDLKAWPDLPPQYSSIDNKKRHPLGHVKILDLRDNKNLPETPPENYFDITNSKTGEPNSPKEIFFRLPGLKNILVGEKPKAVSNPVIPDLYPFAPEVDPRCI